MKWNTVVGLVKWTDTCALLWHTHTRIYKSSYCLSDRWISHKWHLLLVICQLWRHCFWSDLLTSVIVWELEGHKYRYFTKKTGNNKSFIWLFTIKSYRYSLLFWKLHPFLDLGPFWVSKIYSLPLCSSADNFHPLRIPLVDIYIFSFPFLSYLSIHSSLC